MVTAPGVVDKFPTHYCLLGEVTQEAWMQHLSTVCNIFYANQLFL